MSSARPPGEASRRAWGLALAAICALSACGPAGPPDRAQGAQQADVHRLDEPLPDLVAVRIAGPDGQASLSGWGPTPPPAQPRLRYVLHIEPLDPAFAGARAFSASTLEADAVAAAKQVAAAEGFETASVLAQALAPSAVIERLEKNGRVTGLMLEGRVAGKPARFVGYVWYGAMGEPDGKPASGVHAFIAPEPAFVALGGYAVPAILFARAVATPGAPMSVDGEKPPGQAVRELTDLFTAWAGALGAGDNLSALNGIMQGNLGVKLGTGCINMTGCVGGGAAPVYTRPPY